MDQQINVLSEFMKRMKHLYDAAHPNGAPEGLYARLIHEEYKELSVEREGTSNHFKELCDLIWVCVMRAIQCGYPLEEGMEELTKEFNSKFLDKDDNFNPKYREDGKLLKGDGFKKANFEKFFQEK